jgi:DNA polymerase
MPQTHDARELLRWYVEAGVDETIADQPVDRFQPEASPKPADPAMPAMPTGLADAGRGPAPLPPSHATSHAPSRTSGREALFADRQAASAATADGEVTAAVHLAQAATGVEDLHRALASFDGCALKKTATNLVFIDGNPEARILFVGEGPGAEEDRQGLPFVGPSGKLLDKMLASVGLDRGQVLISNTVFWRPPGNRTPTSQETAVCLPFLERLIELVDPEILVALGGPAAKALLGQASGVGRLRGKWFTYSTPKLARPIAATAMFHPAYLLRAPGQKRDTWRDLLAIKRKLADQRKPA